MNNQKNTTAAGVVAIIFGVFGFVGCALLIAGQMSGNMILLQIGDIVFTLFGSISHIWASVLAAVTHKIALSVLVLSLILLIPLLLMIGGIGLAQNKRWGRTFCFVYGIMKLTLDILTVFIFMIFVSMVNYHSRSVSVEDILVANVIVVILLVALSLIFPVFLMVYLGGASKRPPLPPLTPPAGGTPLPPTRTITTGGDMSKATVMIQPQGVGFRSARLVVVSGRDLHREYTISIEDFQGNPVHNVIGSSAECQVVLSGDPSISKRHCEIRMENGHLCLFNLASTNPTLVCRGLDNRIQVSGKEFLKNSDRIWVGSTELQLYVSEFNQNDLGR